MFNRLPATRSSRIGMGVTLAASLIIASMSAQTSVARAAGTVAGTTRTDARERLDRVDTRGPVHQAHAKFHPRLDHNINRYANRSQNMMPMANPRLQERQTSTDDALSSEKVDAIMLVHQDAKPVDIKHLEAERGGEKTAESKDRDVEHKDNAGVGQKVADGGERDYSRDGDRDRDLKFHHNAAVKHATSKKVKRISERIAAYDGANGDSGGGGEQAGTINGPNGPTVGGAIKEFTLGQGSALIAHQQHVAVNTDLGKVHVRPGSVAFVAQIGKSVSVYNLGDVHDGDVHVVVGNQTIAVPVGQHVVLTRETEPAFERINPVKAIHSRNAASDGTTNGIAVYHAEFSPTSALDHIKQFETLINSKRPEDQKLADRLIKTAAVLIQMRPPFDEDKDAGTSPTASSEH